MFWLLILITCVILAYWFLIKPYNYWLEKGVKQANPKPILGDNYGLVTKQQTPIEMVKYFYNSSLTSRYCGIYQMFTPALVLRDPELIKQIGVKEFDHFFDHRDIGVTRDDLLAKNLFSLKGETWKYMRSLSRPAFTSHKLRQMFVLITDITEQFVQYFMKKNEDIVTIELKDTFTRYTFDVIASIGFGIKCDSLKEPDNEFYVNGRDVANFDGFWRNLKFIGMFILPQFFKYLPVKVVSGKSADFFLNLIKGNMKQREEQGIVRPDIIQLLLDGRKNGLKQEKDSTNDKSDGCADVEESNTTKSTAINKEVTDIDITSQTFVFFLAGFDTVSTIMCFMGYELGINPDIQQRLRNEIDKIADEYNDKLPYEALIEMKYMDMVLSETLRKWPSAVMTDRICTKPFTIEPTQPDEKPLHLNVGDLIVIPILGLQHDPKYYPEPDRFDPERFNDENKHKINPYTYMPFGVGPRNCIGYRFALLEIKTLFFYILRHFEIVPIEKTEIPVKISKNSFNIGAENGMWFGLERRIR